MTNNTTNVVTLKSLNWEEAKIYFGFIAFICVIFLPAVVGNLLILYIYIAKKKHNNTRVYINFIAVLDLINCTICYPFSVVNCLLPYMFYSNVACKLFTLITYVVNVCVALSLLVISVDRFRVICKPFGAQISKRLSKLLCILVSVVSIILGFPILIIAETVAIETKVAGVVGRECSSAGDGTWPTVYIGVFSVLTILGAVVLIILYSLMGLALIRQRRLVQETGIGINKPSTFSKRRVRTLPKGFRPSRVAEQDIRTVNTKLNLSEVPGASKSESNPPNTSVINADVDNHLNIAMNVNDNPDLEKELTTKNKRRQSIPTETNGDVSPSTCMDNRHNIRRNVLINPKNKSKNDTMTGWLENTKASEEFGDPGHLKVLGIFEENFVMDQIERKRRHTFSSREEKKYVDKVPYKTSKSHSLALTSNVITPIASQQKDTFTNHDQISSLRDNVMLPCDTKETPKTRQNNTNGTSNVSRFSTWLFGIKERCMRKPAAPGNISRSKAYSVAKGLKIQRTDTRDSSYAGKSVTKNAPKKETFKRTKRTTMMFFWVTFVYVVSFLPNPALRLVRYRHPEWYEDLSFTQLIVYHIAHGSVFLTSAANFFIYIFCDTMFRGEVKRLYRKTQQLVCCWVRR